MAALSPGRAYHEPKLLCGMKHEARLADLLHLLA